MWLTESLKAGSREMAQKYAPDSSDAWDGIRDLIDDVIRTGRQYWPCDWSLEELEAMRDWLDAKLADR